MKYAIAPSVAGGTVEIRAELQGAQLQLQVLDTGPGMADTEHLERRGIGLSNTLERLRALYGEHYEFTFGNRSPQGLAVTFRLPWRMEAPLRQAGGAE
jgi:sensor histidine kinase YesM